LIVNRSSIEYWDYSVETGCFSKTFNLYLRVLGFM
jgi:hypothetical protein